MGYSIFCRKVLEHGYRYIRQSPFGLWKCIHKIIRIIGDKNIWLLGIPASRNLGDQAQVMCTEYFFAHHFPDYQVIEFDSCEILANNKKLAMYISKVIKKDDIVFFQSGYNLTDLYPSQEEMHREIAKRVSNPIVFLPQTISLKEPIETNQFVIDSRKTYEDKNIFLMCRDRFSYKVAEKAFPEIRKIAFPDVVTSLIGMYTNVKERSGYALCVRNDVEGTMSQGDVRTVAEELQKKGPTKVFDTIVESPAFFIINKDRKKYVEVMIEKLQSVKVVVTDKYHGFILSLVANTPVVVIKTRDHKLSEGIKWFPEEMQKYIRIAENLASIPKLVDELEQMPLPQFNGYFEKEYFSHFKDIIEANIYHE